MHVMELCAAILCEIPTIIDGLVFNYASGIRALWLLLSGLVFLNVYSVLLPALSSISFELNWFGLIFPNLLENLMCRGRSDVDMKIIKQMVPW